MPPAWPSAAVLLLAMAAAALVSWEPAGQEFLMHFIPWLASSSRRHGTAELLFTNCTIWTGEQDMPWAASMAVSKGRIVRIGSPADVELVAGPSSRYVDLHGKFVAPGFIDSHVHFIPGGLQVCLLLISPFGLLHACIQLGQLDLRHVRSRSEFINQVEIAAAALVDEEAWLVGFGWSNEHWGGEWPDSSWIDAVSDRHPVWLSRIDGHMGLANKVALDKCHLNDIKADPAGGSIVRDEFGDPTGLLVDTAMLLISSCLPKPSLEDRRMALARANRHAASHGITSVVDFGSYFPGGLPEQAWIDFNEVYKWADALGNMSVRSVLFFPMETWPRVAALVREKGRSLSSWIHIGGVKAFADGSLGSGTARFHEPYVGDPSNFGLYVTEPDRLVQSANAAAESNLQVAVHAIGDRAVDDILSLYGDIVTKNQHQKHRLRIEHAQHLSPGAHVKFAQSGSIASVQPEQLLDDAPYVARKLGEERSRRSYNFASLLKRGALLAMGSDWPVAALNPLGGIAAAVKRTPHGWESPWLAEEKISKVEALTGYTVSAAYAVGLDGLVGSLKAGKLADFVVLSESLLRDSDSAATTRVVATYVGGFKSFSSTQD